ncbi:predicted protein [Lichtheimia corymbifera JMRC:FSU:9682]|uniref:Uncharacterized protein n=1 Tax=Lichtheimia corymbifera JMRC:FSU:9682 TaxID=1263082 RepID=A0A068SBQ2_9FUNG|nr:predicted protein [Lichtheimia corymbifera JMRC:FSU:9682]
MEQETCQHQSLVWLRWMDAIKHRNGESWNVPLVTWHVVNREGPYHRNPAGDECSSPIVLQLLWGPG